MAAKGGGLHGPLLPVGDYAPPVDGVPRGSRRRGRLWTALAIAAALLALAGVLLLLTFVGEGDGRRGAPRGSPHEAESEMGAAAADDARCSEVGAAALRAGGHAVDAAVAGALCLGVVHPMSSGVGGGAFIVIRDASSGESVALDARETAPAAATPVRTLLPVPADQ
jgi:gamma-glutamyltranspeptidase / glutathione hydrolase / leukotriene-C4 hydrolase